MNKSKITCILIIACLTLSLLSCDLFFGWMNGHPTTELTDPYEEPINIIDTIVVDSTMYDIIDGDDANITNFTE